MNSDSPVAESNEEQTFPSLADSPLWAENYSIPRSVGQEDSPPLVIIQAHYPRIANAIALMWGTPDLNDYISELVIDSRRDRAGFPPEVLAAILKLFADHGRRFKFAQRDESHDVWGDDPFYRHAFRG